MEKNNHMINAITNYISPKTHEQQKDKINTLNSNNHYLKIQQITKIYNQHITNIFELRIDDIMINIHYNSRNLEHQINTEFLRDITITTNQYQIDLPNQELTCAPLTSPLNKQYLKTIRATINCALTNQQIITHLTRVLPFFYA
jgi:Uncharacterized conserved protein